MNLEELEMVRKLVRLAMHEISADEQEAYGAAKRYRKEREELTEKIEDLVCNHDWRKRGSISECRMCKSRRIRKKK